MEPENAGENTDAAIHKARLATRHPWRSAQTTPATPSRPRRMTRTGMSLCSTIRRENPSDHETGVRRLTVSLQGSSGRISIDLAGEIFLHLSRELGAFKSTRPQRLSNSTLYFASRKSFASPVPHSAQQ